MKKNKKLFAAILIIALLILLLISCNPGETSAPAPTVPPGLTLVSSAPSAAAPSEAPAAAEPPVTTEAPAATETPDGAHTPTAAEAPALLDEDGVYPTAEDVSLYLHTYGHLPSNFITKTTARAAGWDGGSLERYLPGMCIGGGGFGNQEGLLPDAPGRSWKECDINTLGKSSRGAERLVYSNDGLIYYTADHYESFQLLYGEP